MSSASTPSRSPKTWPFRRPSAISCGPTKMSPRETTALRDYLGPALAGRTLSDAHHVVSLTEIVRLSCMAGRAGELAGRNVLIGMADQLKSGIAMIELDGLARRMLLCPPDLNPDHLAALISEAEIDGVVTDAPEQWHGRDLAVVPARLPLAAAEPRATERATEWLMLTSGTSG